MSALENEIKEVLKKNINSGDFTLNSDLSRMGKTINYLAAQLFELAKMAQDLEITTYAEKVSESAKRILRED